jgi:hypothetical protein
MLVLGVAAMHVGVFSISRIPQPVRHDVNQKLGGPVASTIPGRVM